VRAQDPGNNPGSRPFSKGLISHPTIPALKGSSDRGSRCGYPQISIRLALRRVCGGIYENLEIQNKANLDNDALSRKAARFLLIFELSALFFGTTKLSAGWSTPYRKVTILERIIPSAEN
jgi:hypothetical protein